MVESISAKFGKKEQCIFRNLGNHRKDDKLKRNKRKNQKDQRRKNKSNIRREE